MKDDTNQVNPAKDVSLVPEKEKELKSNESINQVCTKNDPFKTSICTCNQCVNSRTNNAVPDEIVIVTDANLTGWGQISDIVWFRCPVCKKESVPVTPKITGEGRLGNYCINESCRVRVKVESLELTKYINSIS